MKSHVWLLIVLMACSVKRPESLPADAVTSVSSDIARTIPVALHEIEDDSVISMLYQEDDPGTIGHMERYPGTYIDAQGTCAEGTLLTVEWRTENGEERFDLVWARQEDTGSLFSPVITFDNSDYQGASSVALTDEYPLSDACRTIAVTQEYEGGDIDLTRTSTTTFFAASGGGLVEILSIAEEDTNISEYFAEAQTDQTSRSERSEIQVMQTSTNGFKDVRIINTTIVNEDTVATKVTVLKFHGGKYQMED